MLLVVCPKCQKVERFSQSSWEKLAWEHSKWVGSQKVEVGDNGITAIRHECGFEAENSVDIPLSNLEPEDAELTLFGVGVVGGKIDWLGVYWKEKENEGRIYRILKEKGFIS